MKNENQNVEWKEIWKDDYLKWICSFANSTGGVLYIGINDNGKIIGINNAKKLVYEIPHKTKDYLGILVEVTIKRKKNLEYLCIKVAPHPYPVSLRGRYYIRSGSNTYEALGVELDRLMLKKQGIRWEKLTGHKSTIHDLNPYAIEMFKNIGLNNKTLTIDQTNTDVETLLKNLRLYNKKEISLGALLLFGRDPEDWVYNSFIKICEIDTFNQIISKEKISGPLILQLEKTMNILYENFLIEEKLKINKEVLKEILLNAIIHKAYDREVPIEISIYNNKLTIWNSAEFPNSITNSTIYNPHPTIPYNPRIANAFQKCGLITLWGLGTEKIKKECELDNLPLPRYKINTTGVEVRFNPPKEELKKIKKKLIEENLSKEKILDILIKREDITEEDIKKY